MARSANPSILPTLPLLMSGLGCRPNFPTSVPGQVVSIVTEITLAVTVHGGVLINTAV
jgi:hypothetical protein